MKDKKTVENRKKTFLFLNVPMESRNLDIALWMVR